MEAARSRTLEVTILSADNLRLDHRNPRETTNLYVVVRTESIESYATNMASSTSLTTTEGDDYRHNFSWNDESSLLVDVPKHARCMTLEVKSKTTATGVVKNVGVARVAVSDFVVGEGGGGGGSVAEKNCSDDELLRYRLRDWEGRPNGVINFCVKVSGYLSSSSSSLARSEGVKTTEKVSSSCGFQMRASTTTLGKKSRNEVVIGVPLCWNNYTRHF